MVFLPLDYLHEAFHVDKEALCRVDEEVKVSLVADCQNLTSRETFLQDLRSETLELNVFRQLY